MSDWEDEYDAGGVAISKPLPVETLPVKSWRPPSPRGARSRETTSVGAKFGGDGEQWRNWRDRDSESNVCDGATDKYNSHCRSRTGPTGCRGGEDRSGSSPTTLNVENSLVGRIIGETWCLWNIYACSSFLGCQTLSVVMSYVFLPNPVKIFPKTIRSNIRLSQFELSRIRLMSRQPMSEALLRGFVANKGFIYSFLNSSTEHNYNIKIQDPRIPNGIRTA